MDFVTASTGLISPYWMGLPIRYIQFSNLSSRIRLKSRIKKHLQFARSVELNILQIHLTTEGV